MMTGKMASGDETLLSFRDDEEDEDEEGEQVTSLMENIDTYADSTECFGVEMPARLLWEAYVIRKDIGHDAGGFGDTGRASEPSLMDLNLKAVTDTRATPPSVIFQYDTTRPLNPRGLLMAHEEDQMRPVASDMDCLLLGSKNARYTPMEPNQIVQIEWMLNRIEEVSASECYQSASECI